MKEVKNVFLLVGLFLVNTCLMAQDTNRPKAKLSAKITSSKTNTAKPDKPENALYAKPNKKTSANNEKGTPVDPYATKPKAALAEQKKSPK